jgi:lysophospholipase L1-like esterase
MPPSRSLLAVLAAAVFVAGCAASTATTAMTSIIAGGPVHALAVDTPNPATPPPAASAAPTAVPTASPTPRPTPVPTPAPSGPIVALGDSLTYGFGNGVTNAVLGPPPTHSYPWDMAQNLGIPVVNAGISGTTAEEVLDPASFPQNRPVALQLPALLALHPRLMVVGFGANEANMGWPISRTVADLQRLLTLIAAAHVPIVLVGTHVDCTVDPCTTPTGTARQVYTTAWDAALTSLATEFHAGLVLDVEHGFTAADMTDWIHCDALGYRLMAARIGVAVRAKLG